MISEEMRARKGGEETRGKSRWQPGFTVVPSSFVVHHGREWWCCVLVVLDCGWLSFKSLKR